MIRSLSQSTTPNPLLVSSALALLLAVAAGCATKHPDIPMPPVGSLWTASEPLLSQVETVDEPPDWTLQPRLEDGLLFGLGVRTNTGHPREDLYFAMHDARVSIRDWLVKKSTADEAPPGLLPPATIDLSRIRFEHLAHDTAADRWYALAHFDLEREAEALAGEVAEIDTSLRACQKELSNDRVEYDDRIRTALSILYQVERRDQLRRQYRAVADHELAPQIELSNAALRELADDLLSRHGVRVRVEGTTLDVLEEMLQASVASAIGEVHLKRSESGHGLIRIRLNESWTFNRGYNYLELDGEVLMSIEGGDARSHTVPLRIVAIGADHEEASFRATRDARQEVARILRMKLREMGTRGS